MFATGGQNFAATGGSHACAKAVTAGANQFTRLISTFHLFSPVKTGRNLLIFLLII